MNSATKAATKRKLNDGYAQGSCLPMRRCMQDLAPDADGNRCHYSRGRLAQGIHLQWPRCKTRIRCLGCARNCTIRSGRARKSRKSDRMQPEELELLVTREMPFGKHKGRIIADLPGNYLNWFAREGFPQGEIGRLLALMQEIDHNGLRPLLNPLRKKCQ